LIYPQCGAKQILKQGTEVIKASKKLSKTLPTGAAGLDIQNPVELKVYFDLWLQVQSEQELNAGAQTRKLKEIADFHKTVASCG